MPVLRLDMTKSDRDYIEQCLNGHPEDYRFLVRRYQAALLVYLKGLLGNACDAEEVAQEALVRAYVGLSSLKNHESFYPWLVGIARLVAREQYRNRKQQIDLSGLQRTIDHKQREETDMELEKAMAQLPDNYRELIHRRFYVNQSCAQIAEHLNLPLNTVTKRLSRAYARLRELLRHSEVQS